MSGDDSRVTTATSDHLCRKVSDVAKRCTPTYKAISGALRARTQTGQT
jgi:hypothetical protein